jgi:hypothetical protein
MFPPDQVILFVHADNIGTTVRISVASIQDRIEIMNQP